MKFNLLQTFNTNYCADSVEWCPLTHYQHYFVCGTYELQDSSNSSPERTGQTRLGQLQLFSVTKELNLQLHCTVDSSGILDIKWCPKIVQNEKILATANADGRVFVWNFKEPDALSSITLVSIYELNNPTILSLSLDWAATDASLKLCISDSAGYLFVLQLNDQFELTPLQKLKVHDYEAWVVTFDSKSSTLLLSGGDDGLLKITDMNTRKKVAQLEEHKSGVTSIRFNHLNPNIFASGSYDETIKIWDSRKMSQSLSTADVGGGVWRIKWDPQNAEHILVAGMYSGIFLLGFVNSNGSLMLSSSFKQHDSIAYGADICYFPSIELKNYFNGTEAMKLVTTCSFYDKKLCLSFLK